MQRITSQDASGTGVLSATATYPQTPTQGNLLIAVISEKEPGGGVGFDSFPSGWTAAGGNGSTTYDHEILYKIAGASEPTAVTVAATVAVATEVNIMIYEYSGIAASPLDRTTQQTGTNSLTPSRTFTSATRQADELLIASFYWPADTQTLSSWANGFSSLGSLSSHIFAAEKIVSIVDTFTFGMTVTGGTVGAISCLAVSFYGSIDESKSGNGFRSISVGNGMSRNEGAT